MSRVELGVGDLRPVLDVVEPLVPPELVAQRLDALARRPPASPARPGAAAGCGGGAALLRHRPHATVTAMSAAKVRVLALALLAAAPAGRLRAAVLPAAGRVLPDHLPARHREEDGRGHRGPDLEEHDVAPGRDAAVPPLPERLPQHALDLLARVGRRAPRRKPAGLLGLDRDRAHDGLRRRGPAARPALHRARRRQPERPHRRRGHPAPRPSRPARRSPSRSTSSRRLPRVSVRTGYKDDFFMVVQWFPKIGVLQEKGWNCHQFHASSEFFSDFGNYDVSIDVPARYKGKVGATGAARRRARDLGRTRPLPLPAAGRPRLRLDGGPELPRPRGRLPRGGPRRRRSSSSTCSPSTRARPSATSARPRPRSPATAASSAAIPTPRSRSWIRPGGRTARAAWSTRRSSPAAPSWSAPEEHPPARGRDGPRGRPPVLLRPARLQRVRGGVARRGLQHVHDRPRA